AADLQPRTEARVDTEGSTAAKPTVEKGPSSNEGSTAARPTAEPLRTDSPASQPVEPLKTNTNRLATDTGPIDPQRDAGTSARDVTGQKNQPDGGNAFREARTDQPPNRPANDRPLTENAAAPTEAKIAAQTKTNDS